MSVHVCPYRTDAEIASLAAAFLDHSLPKREWSHSAHFATALWLLSNRPAATVRRDMPGLIRAYNAATGGVNSDSEGYHETITQASLAASEDALRRHEGLGLAACCRVLLAERTGDSDWLLAYWSRAVLFSVAARRGWVAPDRAPLPFAVAPPGVQSSR